MARDFQRLSEVDIIEEITDSASVLIELNGEIYRVPKAILGGGAQGMVVELTAEDSGPM